MGEHAPQDEPTPISEREAAQLFAYGDADAERPVADGRGWLNAGTPMNPPAKDPAYHNLPPTVPRTKANYEAVMWQQGGRATPPAADSSLRVPVSPDQEQIKRDIEQGDLL